MVRLLAFLLAFSLASDSAPAGPVLLFAVEDPLHVARERLEAIAAAAGVDFDALDVHVITQPVLHLAVGPDRLRQTVTRGFRATPGRETRPLRTGTSG